MQHTKKSIADYFQFCKLMWLFLCLQGTFESFYLSDEIEMKKNQLVTILRTLPKEYVISFELYPTRLLYGRASLIFLTQNSDANLNADRIYAIWIYRTPYYQSYYTSIYGDLYSISDYLSNPFPVLKWTKISIKQSKQSNGMYVLSILIDNSIILNININNSSEYNDVKLYLSDPWNDVQPGHIRNIFTDAISDSFTLKEETQIIYNQLVGVLYNTSKEYILSFEFKPTEYRSDVWSSILHLSSSGNGAVYGHNTPGVFISPYSYITISSAINYDANSFKIYEEKILPLEEWTKVKIAQVCFQSSYNFSIEINETKIYNLENTDATEFQNVKIYLGNPWMEPQSGYIRNLEIVNVLQDNRTCSLIANLSSNITNEEVYINVKIATSKVCQIDLENITIRLHHENMLSFNRFSWDNLSLSATSIQIELKYVLIYVRKLFIDSHVKFSSVYHVDKSGVPLGKTNVSVVVDIGGFQFSTGKMIYKVQKNVLYTQGMFSYVEQSIPDVNKVNKKCCIGEQNGTFFQAGAHQYKCTSLHKRQQSSCFQREITTGQIKFFPIQLSSIIGCDSKTAFVYGRTFRNSVVEINFNRKKPAIIISNEKWSSLKSNITVFSEK